MTKPNLPEFDVQKINLKTYNNILKKAIRFEKRSHYETLFTKFINDIKGKWKSIKGILNQTQKKIKLSSFFLKVEII